MKISAFVIAVAAAGFPGVAVGLAAQNTGAGAVADAAVAAEAKRRNAPDFTRVHSDSTWRSVMVCTGTTPSRCHLEEGRTAIQAHRPVIRGDAAWISVTTWEPTTNPRRPVYRVTTKYVLARQRNEWVVVRWTIDSQT